MLSLPTDSGPENIMTGEEYLQPRSNGVVPAAAANNTPVNIVYVISSMLTTFDIGSKSLRFLAHDAFIRTNRRTVAMMFIRLSIWDGRELRSYGALWRRFKFMVG